MNTVSETIQDHIQMGIGLMSRENYTEAKSAFRRALEIDPRNYDAYMHLGNAHATLHEGEQAIEAFKNALTLRPDSGEATFSIGNIHFLENDYVSAIKYYNKAESTGYNHVDMYQIMATIYIQVNDYLQALRTINRAIKLAPFNGELRIQKASMQIGLQKFDEALETLDDFAELMPDAFEAYDLRAKIYCAQGQYVAALKVADQAVKRFPEDERICMIRLNALVEGGNYADAKSEAAAMHGRNPSSKVGKELALLEVQIYSAEKDNEKLMEVLDKALEKQPEDADLSYLKLTAYVTTGSFQKTIETADKMVKMDLPVVIKASTEFYRALSIKQLGHADDAKREFSRLAKEFRKITISEPTHHELYMLRLLCHIENGEFEKAMEMADYIQNMYPERGDGHAYRALIFRAMGDDAKAGEEEAAAQKLKQDPLA